MKRYKLLAAGALVFCAAISRPAFAELWQGAATLPEKHLALGFYGQVYAPNYSLPGATMAFGQFTYGQTDALQLETRLGFGMIDFYVGMFAKYRIYEHGKLRIAVLGGVHRQANVKIDGNLIASYGVSGIEAYLAPMVTVPLAGWANVGLIPGLDFRLAKNGRIYLEGDVALYNFYNALSVGYRHFF